MKTFSIVAAAALALIGFADVTYAHDRPGVRDPRVNARQDRQENRIRQGVRSGELTRPERRDLHRELNQASRQIYRQKHDAQDRPAGQ